MSIENGISTLPHSSGVLCVLKGYAVSLRKILKIVQSLVKNKEKIGSLSNIRTSMSGSQEDCRQRHVPYLPYFYAFKQYIHIQLTREKKRLLNALILLGLFFMIF